MDFQTSREPLTFQSHKHGWRHQTVRITKKFLETIARFASSVIACYPRVPPILREEPSAMQNNVHETGIIALPNEILLNILSKCDFSSKMNMRAVNLKFNSLVDGSAKYLTRTNLIGGVQIGSYKGPAAGSSGAEGDEAGSKDFGQKLTLRRTNGEILLPAYRLGNVLRHVCVWHSLHLVSISLDEVLALDLLEASFGDISELVIDRVHSATSETLSRLVKGVYPSENLIIKNHNSPESQSAISPAVFDNCRATDVIIQSEIEHRSIDDETLAQLILCDLTVRRAIHLPPSAITHNGILSAAMQFVDQCKEIMDDFTEEMDIPTWEVSVHLSPSSLIDLNQIIPSADLQPHCRIVNQPAILPYFIFQVNIEHMFLRVLIDHSTHSQNPSLK